MPRVNDAGILIDVITNVDVTGINFSQYKVLNPDKTTQSWNALAVISGSGRLRHVSSGTELALEGEYIISPFLQFTPTKQFHTPAVRFQVDPLYRP